MTLNQMQNLMCCELDGASAVFMLVADELETDSNPLGHPSEWEEQFSDSCDASFAGIWDAYYSSTEWYNPIRC